mgnify:CR=1 FL=1
MPLFIIHAVDKADALELRMAKRPAHLEWGASHADRIAMAGPMFADDGETFAGSVFIAAFDSLEAARAWHAQDPYVKAGLFERSDIRPCKWVIGEGKPPA